MYWGLAGEYHSGLALYILRTLLNKDCWNALLMNMLVVELMAEEHITEFSCYLMDQ